MSQTIAIVGTKIIAKETIAKQFSDFFIDIEPNLTSKIQNQEDISYENFIKYRGPDLEIKQMANNRLHKAFPSLKSSKSSG